jgi:hypothetical protein
MDYMGELNIFKASVTNLVSSLSVPRKFDFIPLAILDWEYSKCKSRLESGLHAQGNERNNFVDFDL